MTYEDERKGADQGDAPRDGGRELSGAVDRLVADFGDFFGDVGRTWLVLAVRPWTAAQRLLEDRRRGGGKYASPSAFVVVASVLAAFFVAIPGGLDGGANFDPQALAVAAMDAIDGDSSAALPLLVALVTGLLVGILSRLAALPVRAESRDDARAVWQWAFGAMLLWLPATAMAISVLYTTGLQHVSEGLILPLVVWLYVPALAAIRWMFGQVGWRRSVAPLTGLLIALAAGPAWGVLLGAVLPTEEPFDDSEVESDAPPEP